MNSPIENKIAKSGLVNIDLEEWIPKNEISFVDLKDYLFKDTILKEKDFRQTLKSSNWSSYKNHYVGIFCSVDVIIPLWASMLVSCYLTPFAKSVYFCNKENIYNFILLDLILNLNKDEYKNKKVVIKGCSNKNISKNVYVKLVESLQPVTHSIMYGEPCSTVPLFKKK